MAQDAVKDVANGTKKVAEKTGTAVKDGTVKAYDKTKEGTEVVATKPLPEQKLLPTILKKAR